MAYIRSNNSRVTNQVPSYYARNKLYPNSYQATEWGTRTSRRIHDGFLLPLNYGLDTVSDDINSSPYSSPYYINGRYNSDDLTLQRGNSASVQGVQRLADIYSTTEDFSESDIQTSIELWQGKQIKFELPYDGKVIGNTITLKNTNGCTGVLSMYFSTKDGGQPIYETAIDLCSVAQDRFEHFVLYGITPIAATANPKKKLYVRMEIWDEISQERSRNPFNTGRKIEIAATGAGSHLACVYRLGEKNLPVEEKYDYKRYSSKPLMGLVYNAYTSVPTERIDQEKVGATVSLNGYRYDIMCCKDENHAEVLIYDREMNKFINNNIRVDGRVETLNIAQCTDTDRNTWVYYVDGYSPLQRFKIGEWISQSYPVSSGVEITASVDETTWWASDLGQSSGYYQFTYRNGSWLYDGAAVSLATYGITLSGVPANEARIYISTTVVGATKTLESVEYVDVRPVVGAKLIMFHNNRLYLAGFLNDKNLVQISEITEEGPLFDSFPYRIYVPNRSPYDTSLNAITAMVEYSSDQIMILGRNFFALFQTNVNIEDGAPQQVSSYMDSAGVEAQGDIVNYKGILYSFDRKEGIRRFTGGLWHVIPNSIDSHYDRVDMNKSRKMWGYANKLYYNYTDEIDGIDKCIVWDSLMNYQQYPWFMDSGIPFCDVRYDEQAELIGIHPDYPCVMVHYASDVWRRFDTPIDLVRHTKHISVPGGNHDMYVKRIHIKLLADANRWVWLGINVDKDGLTQYRGKDIVFREPVWDTIVVDEPFETAFPTEDIYEENALQRIDISNIRIKCTSVQLKFKIRTFRAQGSLVSVGFEVSPRVYN